MKKILTAVVVTCALAAAPLLAQSGQSGQGQSGQSAQPGQPGQSGQPKTTGGSAKGHPGSQGKTASASGAGAKAGGADTMFAKEAAVGGMAEVELGNLAKEKAASSDVKQFGDRMVTDHSRANDELKQWAQQNSVTLPTSLDAKHQALRDRLAKLSGAAFDKAYMHEMVTDHQHDVAAFRRESTSGKNADLKAWAGKTLPTLQDHMKMAQDTASKVGGTGATSTTASKGKSKGKGKGKGKQ